MRLFEFSRISSLMILLLAAFFLGCSKDEDSLSDKLVGDWNVKTLTIDAQSIVPNQMEYDFQSDGDFNLFFLFNNNQVRMDGEWSISPDQSKIELDYTVNQVFFVGVVGFLQGTDVPREEYDILFKDDNEIELEGNINGSRMEINLERD